jgi:hypothetical protein
VASRGDVPRELRVAAIDGTQWFVSRSSRNNIIVLRANGLDCGGGAAEYELSPSDARALSVALHRVIEGASEEVGQVAPERSARPQDAFGVFGSAAFDAAQAIQHVHNLAPAGADIRKWCMDAIGVLLATAEKARPS